MRLFNKLAAQALVKVTVLLMLTISTYVNALTVGPGETVVIDSDTIYEDIEVNGGTLEVTNSIIYGGVKIKGDGNLTMDENAILYGDLDVKSANEIRIDDSELHGDVRITSSQYVEFDNSIINSKLISFTDVDTAKIFNSNGSSSSGLMVFEEVETGVFVGNDIDANIVLNDNYTFQVLASNLKSISAKNMKIGYLFIGNNIDKGIKVLGGSTVFIRENTVNDGVFVKADSVDVQDNDIQKHLTIKPGSGFCVESGNTYRRLIGGCQ